MSKEKTVLQVKLPDDIGQLAVELASSRAISWVASDYNFTLGIVGGQQTLTIVKTGLVDQRRLSFNGTVLASVFRAEL